MINKYLTPPCWSLKIDAGVVVGPNQQAAILMHGSRGIDKQRERVIIAA